MRTSGIVRLSAALLVMIFCVSCAGHKTGLHIEIIAAGTGTEYWTSVYAGAQAAAEQYNANVKMFGPELGKDYSRQENILRQSIGRKPDAILLAAADSAVMATTADLAAKSGITVIAVDSHTGEDKPAAYIGSDNYALGRTLANQIIARYAGGTVAVISFIKESTAANEREAGFLDAMAERTEFRILETVYCDSDVDTAKKQALALLADHDDLTAVACLNGEAAIGAGRAIEEADTPDVFLAGIDCSVEQVELMERGILDVSLLQNPYAMGYFSVETAIKHLRGEPYDKVLHMDFYVITKENMFSEEYRRLIFPLF